MNGTKESAVLHIPKFEDASYFMRGRAHLLQEMQALLQILRYVTLLMVK